MPWGVASSLEKLFLLHACLCYSSSNSWGMGKIGGNRKINFKGLKFISNNNNKELAFCFLIT